MRNWRLRAGAMLLLAMLLTGISAGKACADDWEARDISKECTVEMSERDTTGRLFDGKRTLALPLPDGFQITMEHPEGIGSLYLIFDVEYGEYTVTDNDSGITGTWGTQGFLHDFVDLQDYFSHAPQSVTITFPNGNAYVNEITVYSPGEVPASVQKWELPQDERADLVLFSTHCDDEQLFFGGVLPYYAGELGYRVQVVYLTNHRNLDNVRAHEGLDGLWNVGVTRYPLFGTFGDYYCRSREKAYACFRQEGVTDEDLTAFVVEQMRRYKPLVVLGHDLNGEYGHGQHMLYADAVIRACDVSADYGMFPESSRKYGAWDVPKTYLHLFELNKIRMDWDRPLDHFNGMTAYEVTKKIGFPSHPSQEEGFAWYMGGKDTAAEIVYYSPCEYGLYRSTVGPDINKNDFFENLDCYDVQDEIAMEMAALEEAEAARIKAEEAAAEAERLREQAEAEQAAALEQQTREEAQTGRKQIAMVAFWISILLVSAAGIWFWVRRKNKSYF